jgi:Hg(II)-responsive transcriptional regulator
MTNLTIGQLAVLGEVNRETIRYYERRGLMPAPPRSESGYRQYVPDDVARIRFIKRAQALGFALGEIGELLLLRVESVSACDDVQHQAEHKIADIEAKIQLLARMKQTLNELIDSVDPNS